MFEGIIVLYVSSSVVPLGKFVTSRTVRALLEEVSFCASAQTLSLESKKKRKREK
jgi:hypothetical protein